MPRPKKDSTPLPTANSLVASAAQITSSRRRGVPKQQLTGGWQAEAWLMLDTVGELEFYREWIANALSRVTLHVIEALPDGTRKRVELGAPAEALAALYDGEAGQPQMLSGLAGHLAIPGESWLVGLVEPSAQADGPDTWRVLSRDEIKQEGSRYIIDRGDGETESYEDGSNPDRPAEVLVIRLWRSHPRKWVEAHSSVRSALPILRELQGLTKKIAADIDSRLAGAGILFVPQEMTFTTPLNGEPAADDDADPFMAALTEAMTTAMADRGDASSVVPIVVKAPAQYLASIQHITFWSEFSAEARDLRREAIMRLAASLDVPAEVLTGMGDVNHWTGWLLDDNAIKMHIEPLVEVIAHGLTTRFLWPALQGSSATFDPALRRFTIEGDTSALRQRPNRSAEAQALHQNMVITDAALARETGFEPEDLLVTGTPEFRDRMLQATASGATTPDMTAAALAALGVPLVPKPSLVPGDERHPAPGGAVPEALPPAPAPPATPVGGDQAPPEQAAALLLGSEAVVLRAVEKAWNRAGRRSRAGRRPIEPHDLDACLQDAWSYVPRIAALCGVDEARLTDCLETYTRALLTTGADHNEVAFATMLRDRVLMKPPEALSA